jgi:hypothetical protein
MRLSSTLRHDTRLNPRCCGSDGKGRFASYCLSAGGFASGAGGGDGSAGSAECARMRPESKMVDEKRQLAATYCPDPSCIPNVDLT